MHYIFSILILHEPVKIEMKEDFTIIFDHLDAGILITDTDGMITTANIAARNLLGCPKEIPYGMRVEQLFGDKKAQGTKSIEK